MANPTIGAGAIVKNEGKCIYKALANVSQFADIICISDTGSTDNTAAEIMRFACENGWHIRQNAIQIPQPKTIIYTTFLDASEKDENGNWSLWDFGRARNSYIDILDPIVDYIYWFDIDETVANPQDIRLLLPDEPATPPQIWAFPITSGAIQWTHHRLFQTKHGCRYAQGCTTSSPFTLILGDMCCHEYPSFPGFQQLVANHHLITHAHVYTPVKENSEPRNLRILKRKYDQGDATPRNLFYLATAYRDLSRDVEATKMYDEYLARKDNLFHTERVTATLYRTRCYRNVGMTHDALRSAFEGLGLDHGYSELWVELAYNFNILGKKNLARACAMAAIQNPPEFQLFPEPLCYDAEPARLLKFTV